MLAGKSADLPTVHINVDLSSGVTFDFDTMSNVEIGPDVFTVHGLNYMTWRELFQLPLFFNLNYLREYRIPVCNSLAFC